MIKANRRMMKYVAAAGLVAVSAGGAAAQQCADWRARGTGLHLNGSVYATTTWDPDGAGPEPSVLVVGGSFTRAGGPNGIEALNIATWDGVEWRALGEGLGASDFNGVYALAVYNGDLIAAGAFGESGGVTTRNVARWDGAAWQPLGDGVIGPGASSASCLAIHNGELVVGGKFSTAGGAGANNIARWNGSSWQTMGGGMSFEVASLAVFNDQVVAGGLFQLADGIPANYVARWTGAAWQPLGPGVSGAIGGGSTMVLALKVFNGQLYAGGTFAFAGSVAAPGVARWNGTSWQGVGTGISNTPSARVNEFHVHNGELVAGGLFTTAGGVAASNLARWNGSAWGTVSEGTNAMVNALTTFNNALIAGGLFLQAGTEIVESIAAWNGTAWSGFPGLRRTAFDYNDTGVRAFTNWGGSLILGGLFDTSDTGLAQHSRHLVSWNGRQYRPVGEPNGMVRSMTVAPGPGNFTTDLIVAGSFTSISGTPLSRIGKINDTVAFGWQPFGDGFNGDVNAVTRFNGSVYAAGAFTASGGTALNRIARWSNGAWQPVGPGATTGVNGTIHCMKGYTNSAFNVRLVVGGEFTSAGGVAASRVAQYSMSTVTFDESWNALGSGFNGPVYAVERFAGSTYAAGSFSLSGSTAVSNIARWTGSAWVPLGTGVNGTVRAMTVSNGTLIVAGEFTTAGGVAAPRLARWDGTNWSPVGGGTDNTVFALSIYQNELQVGGIFERVRNDVLDSPLWARYSEDGVPWISEQPRPTSVRCGETAHFHMEPAVGYGGLNYLWRKDGIPLSNGPTGHGSTIVTNGLNLFIQDATIEDAGAYDMSLFNACGGTSSAVVQLAVSGGCCPGDFNGDDVLNSQDFFDFLAAFFALHPTADFNRDGAINSQDFFDFLTVFFVGC